MEAPEAGRDLAVLHGLSFTLPAGLLTTLEGGEKNKLIELISLVLFLKLMTLIESHKTKLKW